MGTDQALSFVVLAACALSAGPSASPRAQARERSVPEVYTAGDEAHWAFEQSGQRIGSCWSRYEGEVDLAGVRAQRFRGQVELALNTAAGSFEQRFTTDLWTDEGGHALCIELVAAVSDTVSSAAVVFAGGVAEASVRQGPTQRTLRLDVPEGAFVLANNFLSHLELMLALDAPAAGESVTFDMFSANTLQRFALKVEHVEDFEDPQAGPGAVYRDSLGEVLRLTRAGRLLEVSIPAQGLVLRRVEEPAALFTIEQPRRASARADFEREEVRVEEGVVSLAGTITSPKDLEGRLPAVFFVSGSGPQDRDGYSSGVDIGTHEILDRLTREGFLVLRVDDRGVGESRGPTEDLSYDDLVEDARRCVRFLAQRPDVDPARIAVIGHSEGGQTAAILAAESDGVAAVVLMAAPGRPADELIREQILRGRRLEGSSEEQLAALGATIDEFFAHVRAGEPFEAGELPEELRMFLAARAWLQSHLRQDPLQAIGRVRSPVLLLQGARDIQVSAERDAVRLEQALDESANPDHELVVFPELDHLFKKTVGAESSGLDYFKTRPVDAAFLDTLVAWLKGRLMR